MKKVWKFGGLFLILCVLSLGTNSIWTVRGLITEKRFQVEWESTFGGPAWDRLTGSAIQSTDGGFVLAGHTQSFGAGNLTLGNAWLIKTDANGQHEWNRTFGGPSSVDVFGPIVQTADGGYLLVFYSTAGTPPYEPELWLLKTDNAGHQVWNSSYEEFEAFTSFSNLIRTSDDGFLLTATIEDDVESKSLLVKLDASGIQQWNSTLAIDMPIFFNKMIHTLEGGFLLVGSIGETSDVDFFVLKLDATGTAEWNTSFGGQEFDVATDVIQIADGSFLLTGPTTSYAFSSNDFWLIKTDSTGHPIWNTTFGGLFAQIPNSLIQTIEGGYLLVGATRDISHNEDVWLVKTDANGQHEWNTTFGNDAWAKSVFQVADDNFVVAGGIDTGESDIWLFKFSVSDPKSTPSFEFSLILLCFLLTLIIIRKRRP